MRKLLTFLIALMALAVVGLSARAHAYGCQGWAQTIGGNGCNSSIAAGGATTTWNPADTSAGFTLSGGNLIATQSLGSSNQGSRDVAGHSTGKFFCSLTINTVGNFLIGISNAAYSLTSGAILSSTNSVGVTSGGTIFFNGGSIAGTAAYTTGDVLDIAVDFTAQLIWTRTNGGAWNGSGDPATGTGGGSFAGIGAGPYFITVTASAAGSAVTANFGGSAYSFAAPSGYGNW
jgi:hypothetical protein